MDKALLFSCSIILHSRAGRSIYLAKEGRLSWWHECVHAAQALWVNEARIITFWTEKAVLGLDQTIYVESMMTSLVLDVDSTEGSNPAKPEDHFGPSASDKGPPYQQLNFKLSRRTRSSQTHTRFPSTVSVLPLVWKLYSIS